MGLKSLRKAVTWQNLKKYEKYTFYTYKHFWTKLKSKDRSSCLVASFKLFLLVFSSFKPLQKHLFSQKKEYFDVIKALKIVFNVNQE